MDPAAAVSPYLEASDSFEFDWPDPADADLHWRWDGMHAPRALPRLPASLLAELVKYASGGRAIVVNGYPFIGVAGKPPTPRTVDIPAIERWWQEECGPACKAAVEHQRRTNWQELPTPDLVAAIREQVGTNLRLWAETIEVAIALSMAARPFFDFCRAELDDRGLLASTMLQGYPNATVETGLGLERLADLAAPLPAVAASVRRGDREGIAAAGGAEFLGALDAWLDEYGTRLSTWVELQEPTWAEDPSVPLRMVARYLDGAVRRPSAALAAARTSREEAVASARERLPAEKFAALEDLRRPLACYVPIIEERAYWQQQLAGTLRAPLLVVGERLVQTGAIPEPADVFHVDWGTVESLARGEGSIESNEFARRRANLARWQRLIPPFSLGAAPPAAPGGPPTGAEIEPATDLRLISGSPASAGNASGRACVAVSLEDTASLEPGDILVCRFTAPTWTPLFATAAAIVTDAGGVLSHAAIVAREYGIPAVVGTGTGTTDIPDGAMITVDGARGLVRIEGPA